MFECQVCYQKFAFNVFYLLTEASDKNTATIDIDIIVEHILKVNWLQLLAK